MQPTVITIDSLQYLNKQRKDTTKTGEPRVRRRPRQPNVAYLQAPAVYMSDDDSVEDESDLADLDEEFKNTEEYKELVRLRKLQAQRKREALVKVVHYDYRVRPLVSLGVSAHRLTATL